MNIKDKAFILINSDYNKKVGDEFYAPFCNTLKNKIDAAHEAHVLRKTKLSAYIVGYLVNKRIKKLWTLKDAVRLLKLSEL
jgi:hypothetical protein